MWMVKSGQIATTARHAIEVENTGKLRTEACCYCDGVSFWESGSFRRRTRWSYLRRKGVRRLPYPAPVLSSCVVLISSSARLSEDDVATFLKGRARSRALRPFPVAPLRGVRSACVLCARRRCRLLAVVVIGASVNSLGTLSAGRADTVHCLPPPPRGCAARLLHEPLACWLERVFVAPGSAAVRSEGLRDACLATPSYSSEKEKKKKKNRRV